MPTGMYPNIGNGMLGLEMSLQNHLPQQNPLPQMAVYNHHESDQQIQHHHPNQSQILQKHPYLTHPPKPKNQTLNLSDDDEPGQTTENSADDGKRTTSSSSPWQRMKWTDNMVRLLIMVVFYIGDEVSSEGNDPSGKKKSSGVLQKKGKWKSVSKAMMERGFYVSPQQCEDKFNDLNKRYKRVNDILGKGTACKVVENQNLLDTMDHLTPKMKEEVKKLLNSKHLFFREMCAYHNSCGHATQQSPEIVTEPSIPQPQSHHQKCHHSTENPKTSRIVTSDNEDDDDDDDDDVEDEEVVEGKGYDHEYDDDTDDKSSTKRQKADVFQTSAFSPLVEKFDAELRKMFQDETKSLIEKKQWMKAKMMQLEEQHMGYECQAFELEKQKLKWLKYSNKKEREMERDKLTNERKRLENERMVLLLRQKEMELIDFYQMQQPSSSKSN